MSAQLPDHIALMDGHVALPRDNGELVFTAPWEARALAVTLALVDKLGLGWETFRQRLIAAIAEAPDRAYYESWAVALERLVVELDLVTAAAIDLAIPVQRPSL